MPGNLVIIKTLPTVLFMITMNLIAQSQVTVSGWVLDLHTNQPIAYANIGMLPSSGSMLLLYPDDDIVIAILANAPIVSESPEGFSDEIQKLGETVYK